MGKIKKLKKLYRKFANVSGGNETQSFNWEPVIGQDQIYWHQSRTTAEGPRILIATSMGCYEHALLTESLLAVALTLRGAPVDFLLCDELLPCCQMTKVTGVDEEAFLQQDHTPRCPDCIQRGRAFLSPLGLDILNFSDHLDSAKRHEADRIATTIAIEDIPFYKYNGIAVGEHANAGALRFYARGDLEGERFGRQILRRYLKSALYTTFITENLIAARPYEIAVFHHGLYVPQGIIGEVCRRDGVRVINWNPSYRKQTFIFSHGDTFHHTMISEPTDTWKQIPFPPALERFTMDYLKSRWQGTQDWIWFHEKPVENLKTIHAELGIDTSRPSIGLLTNVTWDAQLHYGSNAFTNMLEWVFATIDYFKRRDDLQLIIRAHPAEIRGLVPSRQMLVPEIAQKFPTLPDNVFVIPPESQISTYAIMETCDSVTIYNTKTGIELSSMGIPVIVAGEAWIRGKGFSLDASNPQEYFNYLDGLPLGKRLEDQKRLLAMKYAFHFFYRRMIEVPLIFDTGKFKFAMALQSIKELLPGNMPGLDTICHGIIADQDFVFKYEEHLLGQLKLDADGEN